MMSFIFAAFVICNHYCNCQWVSPSPTFPHGTETQAVGYYNGVITLIDDPWIGASDHYQFDISTTQIIELAPDSQGFFGFGQYYTQIDHYLYAIKDSSYYIGIYNLMTNLYEDTLNNVTMETFVGGAACLTSTNTHLIILGGIISVGNWLKTMQVLELSTKNWITGPPNMQQARSYHTCNVHVASNTLYAIGGAYNYVAINSVEKYDITDFQQSQWTYSDPLMYKARDLRSIIRDDYIFVIGGCSETDYLIQEVQIINAITGNIFLGENLVYPTSRTSAITVSDSIYVFGGLDNCSTVTKVNTWQYWNLSGISSLTVSPTSATNNPTSFPTVNPTSNPSDNPTLTPTSYPSVIPTSNPTQTVNPTSFPSEIPTSNPTNTPTDGATDDDYGLNIVISFKYSLINATMLDEEIINKLRNKTMDLVTNELQNMNCSGSNNFNVSITLNYNESVAIISSTIHVCNQYQETVLFQRFNSSELQIYFINNVNETRLFANVSSVYFDIDVINIEYGISTTVILHVLGTTHSMQSNKDNENIVMLLIVISVVIVLLVVIIIITIYLKMRNIQKFENDANNINNDKTLNIIEMKKINSVSNDVVMNTKGNTSLNEDDINLEEGEFILTGNDTKGEYFSNKNEGQVVHVENDNVNSNITVGYDETKGNKEIIDLNDDEFIVK